MANDVFVDERDYWSIWTSDLQPAAQPEENKLQRCLNEGRKPFFENVLCCFGAQVEAEYKQDMRAEFGQPAIFLYPRNEDLLHTFASCLTFTGELQQWQTAVNSGGVSIGGEGGGCVFPPLSSHCNTLNGLQLHFRTDCVSGSCPYAAIPGSV